MVGQAEQGRGLPPEEEGAGVESDLKGKVVVPGRGVKDVVRAAACGVRFEGVAMKR